MALLLRYMFTPWSGDRVTDHRLLGRTLQIFYDGAIISGPSLQGGLVGTSQALKVTLSPLTLDERARVWYAISKPYRLSVTYEVRVVNLDALTVEATTPVSRADRPLCRPGHRPMTTWRTVPVDEKWLFSPIGLRLVDDGHGAVGRRQGDARYPRPEWHLAPDRSQGSANTRRGDHLSRTGTTRGRNGCAAASVPRPTDGGPLRSLLSGAVGCRSVHRVPVERQQPAGPDRARGDQYITVTRP